MFCLDMPHKDDWEFKNLVLYISRRSVLILKTSFIHSERSVLILKTSFIHRQKGSLKQNVREKTEQ